jgi:hypothetical protein
MSPIIHHAPEPSISYKWPLRVKGDSVEKVQNEGAAQISANSIYIYD